VSDTEIASIGRNLAQALIRRAYERDDQAKRDVLIYQTELCAAWRKEQTEPPPPTQEAST
jgi:hypothetical protein